MFLFRMIINFEIIEKFGRLKKLFVILKSVSYTYHNIIAKNIWLSLRKRRSDRRRGLFGSQFFYIYKDSYNYV
jgi:hypothetical protein